MPSVLKRQFRQSLRLDQHSKQMLESKLNVPSEISRTPIPSDRASLRSRNSSKHKARRRPRIPSISSATSRFLRRRSNASLRSQVSGAIFPVELLLRIFHLGAELSPEFPVTVSQVCSHWRILAIHSPKLWHFIRPDTRRFLCARRIGRSSGQLLNIEIIVPSQSVSESSALVDAHFCMASVLPAIKRWKTLSIRIDRYSPFLWNSALSGLCAEPSQFTSYAPELRSLSLVYPANDDTKEFHLFGDHAPKLRDVTLHGIRLRWSALMFENLVSLDYTHHGFTAGHAAVQELLAMLSVSRSHLEVLCVRFPPGCETGDFDTWDPHAYNSVELRSLQKLILRAEGIWIPPDELKIITSKILAPSLRVLELDTMDNAVTFSRKTLRSVVRPLWNHPRIERVRIGNAWNHPRSINAFVCSLPSLSTLEWI